jgi:hypothetical protein
MPRVKPIAALIVVAACSGASPIAESQSVLLAQRDRGDISAMRTHMWHVWAAMTANDAWASWERSDAVFGRTDRVLRNLQPFRNGGALETETLPIGFDVRFNPQAAAHVRAHRLGERHALAAFPEFPTAAIATKSVWFAIKAHGVTAMPVWDGTPVNPDARGNADRTWLRSIKVDPSGRAGVSLDRFHHVVITEATVAAARAATHDDSLVPGDYLALVAMHVTTKEIPEWTWATLWWHDRPDDGVYAAGRPASVAGAYRNYVMDAAYSAETPRDADGGPRSCMNPWLEARFPGGLHSNCVACHQRAIVGATEYLPVTRGSEKPAGMQTDFVWSIALEAR